jgi:iron complex outermembrane receptor protein
MRPTVRLVLSRRRATGAILSAIALVFGRASAEGAGQSNSAAATEGLQEIIVTAQKRAESLQTVPSAISAITGDSLAAMGAVDLTSYAREIPGLTFTDLGTGRQTLAIRGLNASLGSATVSYYIGETPIPAEQGNISRVQANPNLIDLDRVEVLRGPQGTLYGSSSMGGTIRLIPKEVALDQVSGYVDAGGEARGAGSWGYNADGVLNLPLLQDKLGMRAGVWYRREDGFIDRLWGPDAPVSPTRFQGEQANIGRQEIKGGRFMLQFTPNDALSLTGMVYHEDRMANGLGDYTGGALNPGESLRQIQLADIPEPSSNGFTLTNITAKLTLGNASITSSTSYYDSHTYVSEEGTALAAAFFGVFYPSRFDEHHTDRNFTQELRIATVNPIHGFGAIAGVYFNEDHNKQAYSYPAPGWNALFAPQGPTDPSGLFALDNNLFSAIGYGRQRELSEFGELSYQPISQLKFTVGARHYLIANAAYSSSSGFVQSNETITTDLGASYTGNLYKGNISYQLTDNHMLYAQYTEGFRPGFPIGPLPSVCQTGLADIGIDSPPTKVNPDSDQNYEVGAKTTWLERRLQVNLALYRITWKNIQQQLFLPCGEFFDANAGDASSRGVELEIDTRITERLSAGLSASYDRAVLSQNQPSFGAFKGDQLNNVPVQQGAVHVDYTFPDFAGIKTITRLDAQYTGSSYANYMRLPDSEERDPAQRLGALTVLNARATFSKDNWTAALFVDNICDRIARQGVQNSLLAQIPDRPRYVPNVPRTVGVSLHWAY